MSFEEGAGTSPALTKLGDHEFTVCCVVVTTTHTSSFAQVRSVVGAASIVIKFVNE